MEWDLGHWQLDLSISQERYIMQELLHFAENEPGQNVVLCVYQDEPFDIPVSWIDKVPVTGCISFFYVRTKQTNEKCLQYGSFDKQSVRGCAPMPKHYPAKFKVPTVPDGFSPVCLGLLTLLLCFWHRCRLLLDILANSKTPTKIFIPAYSNSYFILVGR